MDAPATTALIARLWEELWGLPVVTPERQYMPREVEGLVWRAPDGRALGPVSSTWTSWTAREMKPNLPLTGNDGIPLRDMWEFQKRL